MSRVSLSQQEVEPGRSHAASTKENKTGSSHKVMPPLIKEFRSYAKARQESKQRLADSQRSFETPDIDGGGGGAVLANSMFQSRANSTNEKLLSIE